MTVITIDEIEKGISSYLYRASKGETFVVTDDGLTLGEISTPENLNVRHSASGFVYADIEQGGLAYYVDYAG